MSFYPKGYEPKESNNDYAKLEEGENRFRIMRKPIMGWEFWYEDEGRKVKRVREFSIAANDERASGGIKEFHAFVVWDYREEMIKLLNITQRGIQKDLYGYANDEDWGDPTEYDIVIDREGTGLDTKYGTRAKPAKKLIKEAVDAFKAVKIDIEQYFTGGHPIVREDSEEKDQVKEVEDVSDDIPF